VGTLGAVSAEVAPLRSVEGQALVSRANPPIEVTVDGAFRYVGHVDFVIKEMAQAELHVFVDATPDKRVRRMIVMQFEGFLPGQHHAYDSPVTSPRTVGGSVYDVTAWRYDQAADAKANPKSEASQTRQFLAARGYALPNAWQMGRFARTAGADLQHELLLFYFEPVEDSNGRGTAQLATSARDSVIARAERTFSIRAPEGSSSTGPGGPPL
jgi:hypothetical protein